MASDSGFYDSLFDYSNQPGSSNSYQDSGYYNESGHDQSGFYQGGDPGQAALLAAYQAGLMDGQMSQPDENGRVVYDDTGEYYDQQQDDGSGWYGNQYYHNG